MSTSVYPMEEITIKEEPIWPLEEENNEDEASAEDRCISSVPFEDVPVKKKPINIEAVESNKVTEDELDKREENSNEAINEMMDSHDSSVSSFGLEEGRCCNKEDNKCLHCCKRYKNSSGLVQHMANRNLYHCKICKENFCTFMRLLKHMTFHFERKVVPCSSCEKIFTTNNEFLQHLKRHGVEKPYPCPTCNKTYNHHCTLQKHLLTHTKKRHRCKYCSKMFFQPRTLEIHERTHIR